MQFLTLGQNQKMPMVGIGSWDCTEEEPFEKAIDVALEKGYRHIDTAWVYDNEHVIGRVLKKWFDSGKLKREDVFITTKLPMIGVRPDKVEHFMKESLQRLQLDYVDLYLIHFPICFEAENLAQVLSGKNVKTLPKTDHVGVWKKMEEQVDAGRTKAIGLSNYSVQQIQTVLNAARIKPANLQVEIHVYMQQDELVDFCHKNGISVVAYSPLANPGFNNFLKRVGHEERILPNILADETILKLAKKYNKSPAQIALKFLTQRNIAVIPKSVTPSRIEENISIFDFKLDDNEMKQLKARNVGPEARVADFKVLLGLTDHVEYPFKN